jgi:hypothetical protein
VEAPALAPVEGEAPLEGQGLSRREEYGAPAGTDLETEKLLKAQADAAQAAAADTGDRVLVLMTSAGDQRATRMVLDNMAKRGVPVEQIDGGEPVQKDRCACNQTTLYDSPVCRIGALTGDGRV